MEMYRNYINGEWVLGGAGEIGIDDPASGQVWAKHALADKSDVDRAVAAAKRAHEKGEFRKLRPVERSRVVRAMGQYFLENKDEIATMLTQEQGKPYWESLIEVEGAARYFEYYGNQAETVEGRSIPLGENYYDFTVYEPYGVTAHVIPWNYPVEMTARSVSAALATGNACIVKSPELTPITNRYFALAAEAAGLPQGMVQLLCGLGQEAGAALTAHEDVRLIVFTGSVETGVHIASAAARNVVPCVLELGGKSAAIVRADADLQRLQESIRWGIFFNAGQVCSAMSRLIVHPDLHDQVVEIAVETARSMDVGAGIERREFGANMGAMVSLGQRDRAQGLVDRAVEQGAKCAAGGHAPNREGYFLQPTVLTEVNPSQEIAQTEVFGPVLSVMRYQDDDEAMRIMNGTEYGLVGGIFTQDIDFAMRAAQEIRAGQVFVNEWYAGGVETPFGGFGKSGYGREKGREALWNYVQTKNIGISIPR